MLFIIVIVIFEGEMKILRHSITILLLLPAIQMPGQIPGAEALFGFEDLQYFSKLERSAFERYFEGDPDYLSIMAGMNPDTDEREMDMYRNWVREIIMNIRDRKFDKLSEARKLRRIREYVSMELLVSYEHLADFEDLFLYGNYNYYTAAAIYALILEQLGITYEIYEDPALVYLLAYPENQQIRVETTRPGYQYFMFDHQTRTGFVEFLYETGVIDEDAFKNTTDRKLFERYFFADYGLNLKEMTGMLYLNDAVKSIEQLDPRRTYYQLEKAFMLYPCYKSQFLLLGQLGVFLAQMDYHNPKNLGWLIKASRLVGYGVEPELIMDYLRDIIHTLLVDEEDLNTFDQIHAYLLEHITDTALIRDFKFLSLYHRGLIQFDNARYADALESLEAAFRIDPQNEDNQNLLVRALAGYATVTSPFTILSRIEHYDTAFSEIESEDVYTFVKVNTYLELFGDFFQLQDEENGKKYMALFESLMKKQPGTHTDRIQIGRSFSSAAIYYYGKGQINRSREIVLRGLHYAPENIELKLKLEALE